MLFSISSDSESSPLNRSQWLPDLTHLSESIHPPVIADPDHPSPGRMTLFRRDRAAKSVVLASVRDDRRGTALDDVNRDLERSR